MPFIDKVIVASSQIPIETLFFLWYNDAILVRRLKRCGLIMIWG